MPDEGGTHTGRMAHGSHRTTDDHGDPDKEATLPLCLRFLMLRHDYNGTHVVRL